MPRSCWLTLFALPLVPAAAAAQDAVTLKLPGAGKGDKVEQRSEARQRLAATKLDAQGRVVFEQNTLTLSQLDFTDRVLERDARSSRTLRHFTRAVQDADGREVPLPLHGRTVLVVTRDGVTELRTEQGEPLPGASMHPAPVTAAGEVQPASLVPPGPVRVGETWALDLRGWMRPEMEARGGAGAARLLRVYREGAMLCATVEFRVDIPLTAMTVQGRRLELLAGSRLTSRGTLEACIDGTSTWHVERGANGIVTRVHAPGADGLDTRLDYESEINYVAVCQPR